MGVGHPERRLGQLLLQIRQPPHRIGEHRQEVNCAAPRVRVRFNGASPSDYKLYIGNMKKRKNWTQVTVWNTGLMWTVALEAVDPDGGGMPSRCDHVELFNSRDEAMQEARRVAGAASLPIVDATSGRPPVVERPDRGGLKR
jgi:hypothetical protein